MQLTKSLLLLASATYVHARAKQCAVCPARVEGETLLDSCYVEHKTFCDYNGGTYWGSAPYCAYTVRAYL